MSWRVALLVPALLVAAAAVAFVPFLTKEREVLAATPQAPPLFEAAAIVLPRGAIVCTAPVGVPGDAAFARVVAARYDGQPASRLTVSVRAGSVQAARADFPEWTDGQALDLPLPPRARGTTVAVCVENTGRGPAAVQGSGEARGRGPAVSELNGRPADAALVLSLLEQRPASLLSRAPDLAAHVSAVGPGWLSTPLVWLIAVLVLLGVPAALVVALVLAGRQP